MEVVNANFIACLALYQAKRDKAIGLMHVTSTQQGLLWYYKVLQQEIAKQYLQAEIAYTSLRQIERRIKRIGIEARKKTTPLERKRELLAEAIKLQELAGQYGR